MPTSIEVRPVQLTRAENETSPTWIASRNNRSTDKVTT